MDEHHRLAQDTESAASGPEPDRQREPYLTRRWVQVGARAFALAGFVALTLSDGGPTPRVTITI